MMIIIMAMIITLIMKIIKIIRMTIMAYLQ